LQLTMNLILFTRKEIQSPLSRDDPRARHVLDVLRCGEGDSFDMGIVDGPRGKAEIRRIGKNGISLDVSLESCIPELHPVSLIVGLPRPASARRILKDLTTLGMRALFFAVTDRGESSYRKSRLWTDNLFQSCLREGAEQAFCTRLPAVRVFDSLDECLDEAVPGKSSSVPLLALDNYEAPRSLKQGILEWQISAGSERLQGQSRAHGGRSDPSCVLAVGSERGWSSAERSILRERGFALVHLGKRVLKTETACIAAAAIVLSALDLI